MVNVRDLFCSRKAKVAGECVFAVFLAAAASTATAQDFGGDFGGDFGADVGGDVGGDVGDLGSSQPDSAPAEQTPSAVAPPSAPPPAGDDATAEGSSSGSWAQFTGTQVSGTLALPDGSSLSVNVYETETGNVITGIMADGRGLTVQTMGDLGSITTVIAISDPATGVVTTVISVSTVNPDGTIHVEATQINSNWGVTGSVSQDLMPLTLDGSILVPWVGAPTGAPATAVVREPPPVPPVPPVPAVPTGSSAARRVRPPGLRRNLEP